MALTIDQLQAKRDKLVEALASGVLNLTIEGRSFSFRSIDELRKAISFVDDEISKQQTGNATARQVVVTPKGI